MDIISLGIASKALKGLATKADITGDTGSILVPRGTTAERPSLTATDSGIRFNTDTSVFETWDGSEWVNMVVSAIDVQGTDTEANILLKSGTAGDLWVASDTLNGWLYDGSSWVNIGPLKGDIGEAGTDGATWIVGTVDPTTEGVDNDLYLNTTSSDYFKKITGVWTLQGNFKGLTGDTGPAGDDVDHISLTSGDGSAGTTDTYTVWGDVGETINLGTFNVYNGNDGVGAINDSTITTTTLWSSDKTNTEIQNTAISMAIALG